jgi:subtilisin family serine protease
MSLGSDFGSPDDADAIVSNAAVDAGIVVVASAGNGGDITDIAGSPANAKKAISVANSVDATSIIDGATVTIDGTQDTFGVTRAVLYDWATKPDLSGDVVEAPNSNPDACAPFSNDEAADIAGKVVLVKWTQEALECGSITRGANLRAAGAIGFIFANSAETFDAGINGDTDIPGVLMVKSGADAIRAALQETKVVTADSTTPNAVTQDFPEDTDKVNTSSSRGIRVEGNLKPDIAAVGSSVFSAAVGKGTEGVSETGTSMSGPTVAGLAALVVQANPTWTPTQVKASIMNTASDLRLYGQDGGERYAPVRVGAGRIQAAKAVDNAVVAEVADDPGAVSVSFGPVEVSGPTTLTKTVNVTNTGVDDVDYDVRYDAITRVAGTSFTVSPETVSVKGGTTEQVTVTFTATGRKALDNTVDPTVGRWSNIGWPRTTLAEASGHVLFTPTSGNQLRVPVYAAPRPVSSLTGGTEVALDPVTGEGTLSMVGEGLGFPFNGTSDEDAENDITSIGAAFELSAVDPVEPECTPIVTDCVLLPIEKSADIRRVGVTTDGNMAYFAVGVDEPWSTPAGVTQLEVLLDTNGNGIEDHSIFTTRLSETDVMVAALYDFVEQEVIDVQYMNALPGTVDTQLYDSDTVVLPLDLDALASAGIDVTNPRVNYALLGWSAYAQFPIDAVGFDDDDYLDLSVDLFTPGLSAVASNGQPFYEETAGTDLQITRDAQVYQDNESLGLMLVHLHNGVGAKSEVLDVLDAPGATTSTLGTTAPSVEVNTPADLSVAVTGVAGTPTGQVEVVSAQTGAVLATGDLNGSGIAALTYTPTSTGTVRMIARYLGDTANAASTSAETTLTVTPTPVPGATTTTLAVKPSSVVRGASVTLDITVAGAQGTPTGQVSVVDRATNVVVGTRDLSAGKATLTFTPTTAGVLVLQATYAGDATFAQSRSVFHRVKVTKAASKVSLKLSSKSGKAKAKVTATIKVPTVNGIRATGRVELLDNGDVVGKAKLSKGKVKVTYKPKGKGKHLLRASYDGDANYLAGLSPRRTYMVK